VRCNWRPIRLSAPTFAKRKEEKAIERALTGGKSRDDGDNLINNVPQGIKASLIITAAAALPPWTTIPARHPILLLVWELLSGL
jgi:hypothetical protein